MPPYPDDKRNPVIDSRRSLSSMSCGCQAVCSEGMVHLRAARNGSVQINIMQVSSTFHYHCSTAIVTLCRLVCSIKLALQ